MKKIQLPPYLGMLALSFFIVSCSNSDEKSRNEANEDVNESRKEVSAANEHLRQAKLDSAAEYQTYKMQMELRLKDDDQRIRELKAKLKAEKKDLNTSYAKDIAQLENRNAELRNRINNYQTTHSDKWNSFKDAFNQEMDEVGKSISRMSEE